MATCRLAARVAQMVGADGFWCCSRTWTALYGADPRRDPTPATSRIQSAITAEVEAMAARPNAQAGVGTGGMGDQAAAHGSPRAPGRAPL